MRPRSFRAEREFGLIIGSVFGLLGLWWIYRGKFFNAAYVLAIAGAALIVLGFVAVLFLLGFVPIVGTALHVAFIFGGLGAVMQSRFRPVSRA